MSLKVAKFEMPARESGLWLDTSDEKRTLAGCKICGWGVRAPYDKARQAFYAHAHDPIFDVRSRVARYGRGEGSPDAWTYERDVRFLLERIHSEGASSL